MRRPMGDLRNAVHTAHNGPVRRRQASSVEKYGVIMEIPVRVDTILYKH